MRSLTSSRKKRIGELRSADVAESTPILYGGSVKPENAGQLLGAPGVDGLLVGGASIEAESFARICAAKEVAPLPPEE